MCIINYLIYITSFMRNKNFYRFIEKNYLILVIIGGYLSALFSLFLILKLFGFHICQEHLCEIGQ